MMTSKFVGYFLEQVSDWQKKLSTADAVISIWFEVQITWSHLESIFIGSEDIRAQLPEQSKQFDTIDTDFKVSQLEAYIRIVRNLSHTTHDTHISSTSLPQLATNSLTVSSISMFTGIAQRGGECTQCGEGHQPNTTLWRAGGHSEATVCVREGTGRVSGDKETGIPSLLLHLLLWPARHPLQRQHPSGGKYTYV